MASSFQSFGSLSNNDGYGNEIATKQEYNWLKDGKYSCCTRGTHFSACLGRTPQNNNISLLTNQWPNTPELIPGFRSMKRLGVFLLPPGWDTEPIAGLPPASNSPVPIYTPGLSHKGTLPSAGKCRCRCRK